MFSVPVGLETLTYDLTDMTHVFCLSLVTAPYGLLDRMKKVLKQLGIGK